MHGYGYCTARLAGRCKASRCSHFVCDSHRANDARYHSVRNTNAPPSPGRKHCVKGQRHAARSPARRPYLRLERADVTGLRPRHGGGSPQRLEPPCSPITTCTRSFPTTPCFRSTTCAPSPSSAASTRSASPTTWTTASAPTGTNTAATPPAPRCSRASPRSTSTTSAISPPSQRRASVLRPSSP